MLDFPARTIQTQSAPENAGTKHLVTQNAVYLGLGSSSIQTGTQQLKGPSVSLTVSQQPASGASSTFATNSTYAQAATKFDWQTPPMLMQVTNGNNNIPGLTGNYYGSFVVDTGLANGIITNGITTVPGATTPCTVYAGSNHGKTTGCFNQLLVQSATTYSTPTQIAISLSGAPTSGNPPAQFTYVFQGVCNNTGSIGCGPGNCVNAPNPTSCYDGTKAFINSQTTSTPLLIGTQSGKMNLMYPSTAANPDPWFPPSSQSQGPDSYNNGYAGTNTGFSNSSNPSTGPAPFLNTGVNFLNYFSVVYDPISGFISYVPTDKKSDLVSATPVLALQGTQSQIPAGSVVNWSIYLFTAFGNQSQQSLTPTDVVLSVEPGGVATFSGQISSDAICTDTTCSNSVSTGLMLNSGTLVLTNANNTYLGATTVNSGATLAVTGSIASSSGVSVNSGGTLTGTGSVPTTTINAGAMLAPGVFAPGLPTAIGNLSVNGSLALASAAIYLIQVSPTSASMTNVSGGASVGGTVNRIANPGSYSLGSKYTLLTTTGGPVTGTFAGVSLVGGSFGANIRPTLSYDANDVYLTLSQALLPTGPNFSTNQQNVANALNAFSNSGGILPAGFQNLYKARTMRALGSRPRSSS
jgi:hypothetical protein